jgi:hypothetical protein
MTWNSTSAKSSCRVPTKSVQGTGASRFAQRQIERHRRLAPVAGLGVEIGHMRLANTVVGIFAAALLVCGCSRSETACVPDVTKTNTINVVTRRFPTALGDTIPSGISVRVYGKIDGTAYLYNPQWGTNKLTGAVNWTRNNDWFQTNCEFLYMPDHVRSGHLTIQCAFQ